MNDAFQSQERLLPQSEEILEKIEFDALAEDSEIQDYETDVNMVYALPKQMIDEENSKAIETAEKNLTGALQLRSLAENVLPDNLLLEKTPKDCNELWLKFTGWRLELEGSDTQCSEGSQCKKWYSTEFFTKRQETPRIDYTYLNAMDTTDSIGVSHEVQQLSTPQYKDIYVENKGVQEHHYSSWTCRNTYKNCALIDASIMSRKWEPELYWMVTPCTKMKLREGIQSETEDMLRWACVTERDDKNGNPWWYMTIVDNQCEQSYYGHPNKREQGMKLGRVLGNQRVQDVTVETVERSPYVQVTYNKRSPGAQENWEFTTHRVRWAGYHPGEFLYQPVRWILHGHQNFKEGVANNYLNLGKLAILNFNMQIENHCMAKFTIESVKENGRTLVAVPSDVFLLNECDSTLIFTGNADTSPEILQS